MDDFEIQSERGTGTTIMMTKWRVRDELELALASSSLEMTRHIDESPYGTAERAICRFPFRRRRGVDRHIVDRGETMLRHGHKLGGGSGRERERVDLAAIHHDALASSFDRTQVSECPILSRCGRVLQETPPCSRWCTAATA